MTSYIRTRWQQARYRRLWREAEAARTEYPVSRFKGRGLVFSVFGESQFEKLWANLSVLRRILKCDLPIEVWHFGKGELTARAEDLLNAFSIRIVDGDEFSRESGGYPGSELGRTTLAIVGSSFEQVLFLDVDSCLVRDPTYLFDELAYRWSGALAWPDILRTDPHSGIWPIPDIPLVNEYGWSAGLFLVDKSRAWRPLSIIKHLSRYQPLDPGPKQGMLAFYAAWKAFDQPHAMTRRAAQRIGGHVDQFDLQEQLLFQTKESDGWVPSPDGSGAEPHFVHQAACVTFSEEFRERWPASGAPRQQRVQHGRHKRVSPWTCLLAMRRTPARQEAPHPRSCSEAEMWDAMALSVLRSPNLVAPSTMGTGIEALSRGSEKDARAILRLFATLIFVDPRLTAMLPRDLDIDGTGLEWPWHRLLLLADELQSRNSASGLIGVRGDFFAREAAPQLSCDEMALVRRLNEILADCETDLWREWLESWTALLPGGLARPEGSLTSTTDAVKTAPDDKPARKTWRGKARHDTVLVLTPIKDAADLAESYCSLLTRLSYPPERLSLGMLESDSSDGTYETFDNTLSSLRQRWRRVELCKCDFHYRIPAGLARWETGIQLRRRKVLAQSRNELLKRALKDEDWVLWLDVDVIDYPQDIVEQLLSYGKEILHPHCVFDYGGQTFDRNAWREHGRVDMSTVRGRELLAPLDAVGGTMLLIRADLHRRGLIFPETPYGQGNPRIRDAPYCHDPSCPGELETEGLGIMASDMNVQCWGLPELEILHRKR